MTFQNHKSLIETLKPLVVNDDSPYCRFSHSVKGLATELQVQFNRFGTPEEEKDRIVGHCGLLGETNNTLGYIFHTQIRPLAANDHSDQDKLLRWTRILCERVHQESQMSRARSMSESVIEAYHRMGKDIESWMEDHQSFMEPEELANISSLLADFRESYAKLEDFIEDASAFFGDTPTSLTPRSAAELRKLAL